MLGRTHMITTTATGLFGLYGLRELNQMDLSDVWYGNSVEAFTELIRFDLGRSGFSLLLMLLIGTAGLLLGSLLPDIDSKRSILGRYVPFVEDLVGHRTITHTVWVIALLIGLAYYADLFFVWMIVFGYIGHVIQDSFSVQGIAWFYPLGSGYQSFSGGGSIKKGFHIGLYRVGSGVEMGIFVLMVVLQLWVVYKWGMVFST